MLKSCQYCGKIHDSKYDCGKKPQGKKLNTRADKFRWSKAWQQKRKSIRERDNNICQVCARGVYSPLRQYETDDLSVHHARPIEDAWEQRLDDDNLITLCGTHHEMAEDGRIPYETIKKIIEEQENTPPCISALVK